MSIWMPNGIGPKHVQKIRWDPKDPTKNDYTGFARDFRPARPVSVEQLRAEAQAIEAMQSARFGRTMRDESPIRRAS
jgi:hypothetical protein